MVLKDNHALKPAKAMSGPTNRSTRNELNIPRNNPPIGEAKKATTSANERAPLAISAMSFLPPPPPGGRLYMYKLLDVVRDFVRPPLLISRKDFDRALIVDSGENGDDNDPIPCRVTWFDFNAIGSIENASVDAPWKEGTIVKTADRNAFKSKVVALIVAR